MALTLGVISSNFPSELAEKVLTVQYSLSTMMKMKLKKEKAKFELFKHEIPTYLYSIEDFTCW